MTYKLYWDWWCTGSRNHKIQMSGLALVHWPTHPKNRPKQLANRNRSSQSKELFVSVSKSSVSYPVVVVKINVEGSEYRTIDRMLKMHTACNYIIGELHLGGVVPQTLSLEWPTVVLKRLGLFLKYNLERYLK
jgi:hypothetical protein